MEAIRVASATLASTSVRPSCAGSSETVTSTKLSSASSYTFPKIELDLAISQQPWRGLSKLEHHGNNRSHVVRVMARELVNLNGATTKVNGTKVDGASKLAATLDTVPNLHLESCPALNDVTAALAAAISKMDKREKDEKDGNLAQLQSFGRGKLAENDFMYRQMFVIRSYEVGFDRTATIETLSNLFQECALNHVGMTDFCGDGLGTTHAMMRHRLIWVVTRMQIQVERYPIWGDVVEIDTWVAGEGKNGMRRDWLVTDYKTGEILARATSTWVNMNQDTRRLSRMPDDVRSEISPYFLDRWAIKEDSSLQRTRKLGDNAEHIRSDLVPRLNDMDMNRHVNNVKYIGWALESVPQSLSVAHELTSMALEYKRECSASDVVQSLTSPDVTPRTGSESLLGNGALDGSPGAMSCSLGALKPHTQQSEADVYSGPLKYTHLLRLQTEGAEIVRGRTEWRLKQRYVQ
ncbi:unnamed protein product [Calypogeia fissa]